MSGTVSIDMDVIDIWIRSKEGQCGNNFRPEDRPDYNKHIRRGLLHPTKYLL